MSALRFSRLHTCYGHHLKNIRLHQVGKESSGMTTFCHMVMKKQSTKFIPMKRQSLSVTNIISPSFVALMSTRESRPASNKVTLIDNSKTIYVGGSNFDDYSEEYLKELCSQFGPVNEVYIQHVADPGIKGSYGFAFVVFDDHKSVEKAASLYRLQTPYGPLHLKRKKIPVKLELRRTYVVHGVASNVTIQQVHDYFKRFCGVILINRSGYGNMMYIVFKEECDHLLDELHEIDNSVISLERIMPGLKAQRRDRCKKVKVVGVPDSINEEEIRSHFEKFSPVMDVYLGRVKKTGERNGRVYVNFYNQTDAHFASQNNIHEINGFTVTVMSQGALYVDE